MTDDPESAHRVASKIRSRVYIAQASEDPSFTDENRAALEAEMKGVDYTIEKYPAKHGWVLRDTPVHDATCEEKHWQTLTALLEATIR